MEILYKQESYNIMGACFEFYREMGCGLKESVYHECLEKEFCDRKIPAVHEPSIKLRYKEQILKTIFEPDFICHEKIILELKSVKCLTDIHQAQVQNYLRATGLKLGILVNFGYYPKVEALRIVLDQRHHKPPRLG